MGELVTIDIDALKTFHSNLTGRLAQLDTVERHLLDIAHNPPSFGTFTEARRADSWYRRLHGEHVERVARLRRAVVAAQNSTAEIIANYTGNEAAQRARLDDLRNLLNPITAVLGSPDVGRA